MKSNMFATQCSFIVTLEEFLIDTIILYVVRCHASQVLQQKQGKSEGFDSCNRPSLTQIGFKSSIFRHVWPLNSMDDLENYRVSRLHHIKLYAWFQSHGWIQTEVTVRSRSSGHNWRFCVPCELGIWWMTLKNNRAHLLCHFTLCASFRSHRWIITKSTVRKRSIRVKISYLLFHVTLKSNG